MTFTNTQIDELVEYLRGTPKSLEEGMQQLFGEDASEDDLSQDDHGTIDQEIFRCEVCDWWCERNEEDDEELETCGDCAGHNREWGG